MNERYLTTWLEKRLRILFDAGQMLGIHGASKITIALRPECPSSERVEGVISNFIEKMAKEAVRVTAKNAVCFNMY